MTPDSATVWFRRFGYVALLNSILAVVWTIPVLIPDLRISRTIAGGSVGTWGFIGWTVFMIVGIPIVFASGVAYYLTAKANESTVYSDKLALAHLVLLEVGTLGASGLLALTGYIGGTTLLDNANDPNRISLVHEKINQYVNPIAGFIIIGMIGAVLGIVNLMMMLRVKRTL